MSYARAGGYTRIQAPLKLIDGTIARARLCELPNKLAHPHKVLAEMRRMSPCGLCLPTYSAIARSREAVSSASDLAPFL